MTIFGSTLRRHVLSGGDDEIEKSRGTVRLTREGVELGDGLEDGGVADELRGERVLQVAERESVWGRTNQGLVQDQVRQVEGISRATLLCFNNVNRELTFSCFLLSYLWEMWF